MNNIIHKVRMPGSSSRSDWTPVPGWPVEVRDTIGTAEHVSHDTRLYLRAAGHPGLGTPLDEWHT